MSSALARITVTVPRRVLADADRAASRLDRSRSWVVAEALRRFTERAADPNATESTFVREPAPASYLSAATVAEVRRRHLQADLARTAEERLGAASELVQLGRRAHPRARRRQVIGFDSYEDFWQWKKARRAGA